MQQKIIDKVTYIINPRYGYYEPVKCSCGNLIRRVTQHSKSERYNFKTGKYYTVNWEMRDSAPNYMCPKCYKYWDEPLYD